VSEDIHMAILVLNDRHRWRKKEKIPVCSGKEMCAGGGEEIAEVLSFRERELRSGCAGKRKEDAQR
jgi:hypothetical protein